MISILSVLVLLSVSLESVNAGFNGQHHADVSPRSHSGSSSFTSPEKCHPCPSLPHPTEQCYIPTTCHSGYCSAELDRCGAEYLNAHGSNIDLNPWMAHQRVQPDPADTINEGLVYKEIAATDSADDDNVAETDSTMMYRESLHIHKVGCTRCGKPWPCWYNSDCEEIKSGAYCYQSNKNHPGICQWAYRVQLNSGKWVLHKVCCER